MLFFGTAFFISLEMLSLVKIICVLTTHFVLTSSSVSGSKLSQDMSIFQVPRMSYFENFVAGNM